MAVRGVLLGETGNNTELSHPTLYLVERVVGTRAVRLDWVAETETLPQAPVRFAIPEPGAEYSALDLLRTAERAVWVEGAGGWLLCPDSYIVRPSQRHEGSDASYFVDGQIVGDDAVFVYWLLGATSQHIHDHPLLIGEDYFLLWGQAAIAGIPMDPYVRANHVGDHQVTSETGALVCAILRGAAAVDRSKWHTRLH